MGLVGGACGVQVAKEELAALLEAQQDVRRAMQSVQSSRRLDEEQQEQQQQHLADAEARANKLRMLVHGPQAPAVSPSFIHSFMHSFIHSFMGWANHVRLTKSLS